MIVIAVSKSGSHCCIGYLTCYFDSETMLFLNLIAVLFAALIPQRCHATREQLLRNTALDVDLEDWSMETEDFQPNKYFQPLTMRFAFGHTTLNMTTVDNVLSTLFRANNVTFRQQPSVDNQTEITSILGQFRTRPKVRADGNLTASGFEQKIAFVGNYDIIIDFQVDVRHSPIKRRTVECTKLTSRAGPLELDLSRIFESQASCT